MTPYNLPTSTSTNSEPSLPAALHVTDDHQEMMDTSVEYTGGPAEKKHDTRDQLVSILKEQAPSAMVVASKQDSTTSSIFTVPPEVLADDMKRYPLIHELVAALRESTENLKREPKDLRKIAEALLVEARTKGPNVAKATEVALHQYLTANSFPYPVTEVTFGVDTFYGDMILFENLKFGVDVMICQHSRKGRVTVEFSVPNKQVNVADILLNGESLLKGDFVFEEEEPDKIGRCVVFNDTRLSWETFRDQKKSGNLSVVLEPKKEA